MPRDAGAVAVGADEVALALEQAAASRGIAIDIVRTGSRGLYWLEPMVEVATPQGRVAFGPLTPADAAAVLDAMVTDGPHPLRLGIAEQIPWLKRQTRLTFARCGVVDPRSIEDYRAHQGYKGLERALELGSDGILADVTASGLRGRGGAGFPTGIKWKTVAQTSADRKYIVCNADEGDSGTFADRMIMEGDPFVRDRGHDDRGHRGRRQQGLHLHPLGISPRRRGDERGDPVARGAPASSVAARTASIWRSGSAPAPMSAARKPRCWKAWKAAAASSAPSRRCRRTRACSASRP